MKKGKFIKALTIFGTAICAPLLLSGCMQSENKVEFRVQDGYIQVTEDGNNWENLISINALKGSDGEDGEDAPVYTIGPDGYWYVDGVKTNNKALGSDGEDGKGIKSITKDTHNSNGILTRYIITFSDDTTYAFEVLNGEDAPVYTIGTDGYWYVDGFKTDDKAIGENGEDLIAEDISVYFDLNIPTQLECISSNLTKYFSKYESKDGLYTKTITKGDRIELQDFSTESIFKDYFMGWYENLDDEESKVNEFTMIPESMTITAKWNTEKIEKDFRASEGLEFNYNTVVSYYNGTDTDLVIPKYREVDGKIYTVREISGHLGIGATLSGLTSITIPDSIVKIGDGYSTSGTFGFNSTINAVYIDNIESWLNIEFDQTKSNPLYAGKGVLYIDGRPLNNLIIPDDVTEIKDYAFYGCSSITDISIGSQVKKIGTSAFAYCESLTSVIVPYGVETIEDSIFANCENLSYAQLPDSLTSLGISTFENCYNLSSVRLSNNITTIPSKTFYNCSELRNIKDTKAVKIIEECAFENCESIEIIVLSKVTQIGNSAFKNCSNLDNENMRFGSLEYVGSQAFDGCNDEMFYIQDNGRYIIGNGLSLLYDIVDVNVSEFICDNVKTIAEDAFVGLTMIEKVTLDDSIKYISIDQDRYCGTTIKYNEYNNGYYLGTDTNPYYAFIKPIEGTYEEFTLHADTKIIASEAFLNSKTITKLVIPEGVTHIGKLAFFSLNIGEIIFPSTIENIVPEQWNQPLVCANIVIESQDIEYIDDVVERMGYVETIYLQAHIDTANSSYFINNFTKQETSDKVGYDMWIKA